MAINHHKSPEQLAISASLAKATETVTDLPYEEQFQAYAMDHGVDVINSDTNPLTYWETVKNYVSTELDQNGTSKLEGEAQEVIAGLPLSLTESYVLKEHGRSMRYTDRHELKEGISGYNKVLKDFIETHPQSSDELKASLLNATLATMGDDSREFTDHAQVSIEAELKGMKHEIAFGKVLDALGVTWREATVEEDLKGRDIIIDFGGNEVGIDVKASLSELEAHGGGVTSPVVYEERNNRFIVFSGFLEKEFQGGFSVASATIKEKAPTLGGYLQQAIMQQAQRVLR